MKPSMPQQPRATLDQILEGRIEELATTLQHFTILNYESALHRFLDYLHATFPQVRYLSQLRRDPHLLGWFRWLCETSRSNTTREGYLLCLRRLFRDLDGDGRPPHLSELILSRDIARRPLHLPRALSPQDDQLLQQELRRTDDLYSNALLLMRATGIRLGECIHLALDCLEQLGQDQWALHVPLGKLHSERLVPVDDDVRQIISRILALRPEAPAFMLAKSARRLLPNGGGFFALRTTLRKALTHAVERAGCTKHVTPHQLRHTFATEMVRLGVSLPALMRLMGHTQLRMTLRYVQVTQQDLQREFHLARQKAEQHHLIPQLPLPESSLSASSDLPGISRALAATRHLLEMYRRQSADQKTRHTLQRLDKRLLTVAFELNQLVPPEK